MLSSVTLNCQVTKMVWIEVLNCQNCNQCLKCPGLSLHCKNFTKKREVNVCQVMFPHQSDQVSQRSHVFRVALCMSKVKVPWLTDSVSQWQGHLLSCSGQLKHKQQYIVSKTNLWSGRPKAFVPFLDGIAFPRISNMTFPRKIYKYTNMQIMLSMYLI